MSAPLVDERAANDDWEGFCKRIGWRAQAVESARSLPVDFEVRLRERVLARCDSSFSQASSSRGTALATSMAVHAHALEEPGPSSVSGVRERAALFEEMDLEEERWHGDEESAPLYEAQLVACEAPVAVAQPVVPIRSPEERILSVSRQSTSGAESARSRVWRRLGSLAAVAALGLGTAAMLGALSERGRARSDAGAGRATSDLPAAREANREVSAEAWPFSDDPSVDDVTAPPSATEAPSDAVPPSESASVPTQPSPGMLVASLRSAPHVRRARTARVTRARVSPSAVAREERRAEADARSASSPSEAAASGAGSAASGWSEHDASSVSLAPKGSGAALLRRGRAEARDHVALAAHASRDGDVLALTSAEQGGGDAAFKALEGAAVYDAPASFAPASDAGADPLSLSLPRANGSWYGFSLPPAGETRLGPSGMGVMAQIDLGRALRVQ